MRRFITISVVSTLLGSAASIALGDAVMAQETQAERGSPAQGESMPLPLKVVGTRIVNSRNEPVRLRGVNAACLEWTSNGEGHILNTVNTAIRDWHVNHHPPAAGAGPLVRQGTRAEGRGQGLSRLVKQVVDRCAAEGCYVILDLHWSDAGEWGKQIGQHVMPDRNSLEFWKEPRQHLQESSRRDLRPVQRAA